MLVSASVETFFSLLVALYIWNRMHDKVKIVNLNLARKDTFLIWVLGKIGVQGIPHTIY